MIEADPWLLLSISFALSQLLLGLMLLPSLRPLTQEQRFYAAFLVAVGAYLLDPLVADEGLSFVLQSITVFVPGMFFLFSASLFDDDFQLQPWHFFAVGLTVVPPFIGHILHGFDVYGFDPLMFVVPQLLEFLLLGLALVVAVRFWSPDLVARRRQLRVWFSGFTGLYILTLILLRETVLQQHESLAALQFLPPCGLLFATNMLLLRYRRDIWGAPATGTDAAATGEGEQPGPTASPASDAATAVADEDLQRVRELMEEARVYREMGLTLADLGRQAGIPVYRLREAINGGLGYRNFNDFLNSYRVREAAERLGDEAQRDTQVLVIALEAGFRSLSTFNKAFRTVHDRTPTEYRRDALEKGSPQ